MREHSNLFGFSVKGSCGSCLDFIYGAIINRISSANHCIWSCKASHDDSSCMAFPHIDLTGGEASVHLMMWVVTKCQLQIIWAAWEDLPLSRHLRGKGSISRNVHAYLHPWASVSHNMKWIVCFISKWSLHWKENLQAEFRQVAMSAYQLPFLRPCQVTHLAGWPNWYTQNIACCNTGFREKSSNRHV